MERLSARWMYYSELLSATLSAKVDDLKHIQNLIDAEEQGLLLLLPCKVGDTVYVLTPKKNDYIETDVKRIVVYDNDIEIVTCICVRSIKEIGKTVFFTREQAEKKIK